MSKSISADARKRILFLSGVLGVMAGLAAYLVFKAVHQDKPALIAVVLPLVLTAIPLIRAIAQLRRGKPAD